jgi:fructoselysine-6-P-deglycase FrlB-like protein
VSEQPSSFVEQELASQPDCWAEVVAQLDRFVPALPQRGERVAVVGCGTSLYMSRGYAALREAAGEGETDAFPASEFPAGRRYDRIVAITRSGTTTELVDLLRSLAGSTPTTTITADAATPAAELATDLIELTMATEQSVVQTRFPTSALALFRASLGEDLSGVIAAGRDAVTAPLPTKPGEHHQFTFLGRGWAAAVAEEAGLKCREAAGAWTEAYPAMEYRHGPISVSGDGTVVWVFGDAPAGLAGDVAATGATFVDDVLDPLVDLIRAQRLAVALAHTNGRDPDHPLSLSFSVILNSDQS